jgi:hypothetical protein
MTTMTTDSVKLARDIELARLTLDLTLDHLECARTVPCLPAHLAEPEPFGHGLDLPAPPYSAALLKTLHVAALQADVEKVAAILTAAVYRAPVEMTEIEPGRFLPFCPCGSLLYFRGVYGAPGTGSSWECDRGHVWARVGCVFRDPAEGAHILTAADVI